MENETYKCRIKCKNCQYGYPNNEDMKILKGIKEKQWSSETECPRCGCKGTLYFYGGCY